MIVLPIPFFSTELTYPGSSPAIYHTTGCLEPSQLGSLGRKGLNCTSALPSVAWVTFGSYPRALLLSLLPFRPSVILTHFYTHWHISRLQQNQFTGSIPTFVNPPALLDLSGTLITGSIPNSLLSNPSIVVVHLKGVAISGSLPSNMNAPSLRTLYASLSSHGQLFGISKWIFIVLNLSKPHANPTLPWNSVISGSSLSGSIPASISSSPTLEHLYVLNFIHSYVFGVCPPVFSC